MPISSVNRVKTITVDLTSVTGDDIVTIYQNSGATIGNELIPGYKIVSFNCFLKNLKAFSKIQSLEEALLPNFLVEDSATDKLYKTLDIEWKSPRKQLSLYIASGNAAWSQVGSVSLLNPAGYPFRIYNLMDMFTDNLALELGDNSRVGIGVDEVGYGLLEANDNVTIHGSYVEEIFVKSADIEPITNVSVNPIIQLTAELPIQLNAPITIPLTIIGGYSNSPDILTHNETLADNNTLAGN